MAMRIYVACGSRLALSGSRARLVQPWGRKLQLRGRPVRLRGERVQGFVFSRPLEVEDFPQRLISPPASGQIASLEHAA